MVKSETDINCIHTSVTQIWQISLIGSGGGTCTPGSLACLDGLGPDNLQNKLKNQPPAKKGLNPFQNRPLFIHVCSRDLLKTLWEKEKLLVTSNFSFFHSVFYLFGELSVIFIKSEIVVCKLFQFGRVQNFLLEKGLMFLNDVCSWQVVTIMDP